MKIVRNKLLFLFLPLLFLVGSCEENEANLANFSPFGIAATNGEEPSKKDDEEDKKPEEPITGTRTELCVLPGYTPVDPVPETSSVDPVSEAEEQPHREIHDEITAFVTKHFFGNPESLYNFLKLVYLSLDKRLKYFREEKGLPEEAVFLVFKGGNVLRITANGIFNLLPEKEHKLLKDKYAPYFKRSDSDFSVYIDEKKLNGLDYDTTFEEINDLIFNELSKIREQFKADPSKYFSFFDEENDKTKQLQETLEALNSTSSVKEEGNPIYFKAKFYHLQLLNYGAKKELKCPAQGRRDARFANLVNNVPKQIFLTDQPDWLVNTDNRTIEFPWESDPSKVTKFFLPRTKVVVIAYYKKGRNFYLHSSVGELIDVSIMHRKTPMEDFLSNYERNVVTYTLHSADDQDQFEFKSYSIAANAEDLMSILFESNRPWHGGPKYKKRVYRLSFFHIIEMMNKFGIGSRNITAYVNDIKNTILLPIKTLYPQNGNSETMKKQLNNAINKLTNKYKAMEIANEFWTNFSTFMTDRVIDNPLEDDQAKLEEFIDLLKENLDIAQKLGGNSLRPLKIDANKIYDVPLKNLF